MVPADVTFCVSAFHTRVPATGGGTPYVRRGACGREQSLTRKDVGHQREVTGAIFWFVCCIETAKDCVGKLLFSPQPGSPINLVFQPISHYKIPREILQHEVGTICNFL